MYRGAVVVLVLLESSTAFLTRGHTIAKAARPGRALAGRALPGFHTGVGAGRGRTGEMCDVSAGPPVVLIRCFSRSYLTHQLGSGSSESLRRKR